MKRNTRITIISGVVTLLLAGFLLLALMRNRELDFEISLSDEIFVQRDSIPMTISVRNISGRKLQAATWGTIYPEDCRYLLSEALELELYYEQLSKPKVLSDPLDLRPRSYRRGLTSGEELVFRCDIAEMFGVIRPGRYRLKGAYFRESWARHAFLKLPAVVWSSVLRHDGVDFEVKEP